MGRLVDPSVRAVGRDKALGLARLDLAWLQHERRAGGGGTGLPPPPHEPSHWAIGHTYLVHKQVVC